MFFQRKDVKKQKIEELLLENYNRYYRLHTVMYTMKRMQQILYRMEPIRQYEIVIR